MGKARVDFYSAKGEALTRTHHSCPKCGPGIFLAEHASRRSCGRCGYMESKAESKSEAKPAPPKGKAAPKAGGAPAPPAPKSPAPPAPRA